MMKTPLIFLIAVVLVSLIGAFIFGLSYGHVIGPHPRDGWIARVRRDELPTHFWSYLILHALLYFFVGLALLSLWNSPAF